MNKKFTIQYANTLVYWITSDSKVLFQRIDDRAEDMVTKGLKECVQLPDINDTCFLR